MQEKEEQQRAQKNSKKAQADQAVVNVKISFKETPPYPY